MNTHPPIKYIQSVTLPLYIYFGRFMGWEVGGDGMVEGFKGWLVVGWVVGWRVHGMGVCVVVLVVVGWVVGGFMGWVQILTHP